MKDEDIITTEEAEKIILALLRGNGQSTESDIEKAVDWARELKISQACFELLMKGMIDLKIDSDEILITKNA